MTKVLVVEDSLDIRILLVHTLEDVGYDVVAAGDGETGLQMAREGGPGVILLDIMMPVMDGIQVLQRLKGDGETRCIPVIMVSAKGQEKDVTEAMSHGAYSYVIKPWDLDDLESKVADAAALAHKAG